MLWVKMGQGCCHGLWCREMCLCNLRMALPCLAGVHRWHYSWERNRIYLMVQVYNFLQRDIHVLLTDNRIWNMENTILTFLHWMVVLYPYKYQWAPGLQRTSSRNVKCLHRAGTKASEVVFNSSFSQADMGRKEKWGELEESCAWPCNFEKGLKSFRRWS